MAVDIPHFFILFFLGQFTINREECERYFTVAWGFTDGIFRLCAPIFKAGYLDKIGMQEHDFYTHPPAEEWIGSYNKFEPICPEMAVPEFDTGMDNPSVIPNQAQSVHRSFQMLS